MLTFDSSTNQVIFRSFMNQNFSVEVYTDYIVRVSVPTRRRLWRTCQQASIGKKKQTKANMHLKN